MIIWFLVVISISLHFEKVEPFESFVHYGESNIIFLLRNHQTSNWTGSKFCLNDSECLNKNVSNLLVQNFFSSTHLNPNLIVIGNSTSCLKLSSKVCEKDEKAVNYVIEQKTGPILLINVEIKDDSDYFIKIQHFNSKHFVNGTNSFKSLSKRTGKSLEALMCGKNSLKSFVNKHSLKEFNETIDCSNFKRIISNEYLQNFTNIFNCDRCVDVLNIKMSYRIFILNRNARKYSQMLFKAIGAFTKFYNYSSSTTCNVSCVDAVTNPTEHYNYKTTTIINLKTNKQSLIFTKTTAKSTITTEEKEGISSVKEKYFSSSTKTSTENQNLATSVYDKFNESILNVTNWSVDEELNSTDSMDYGNFSNVATAINDIWDNNNNNSSSFFKNSFKQRSSFILIFFLVIIINTLNSL